MKKKNILCLGSSPLQNWANEKETWIDVWLRFKDRRRNMYLAPCLMGTADLDGDIDLLSTLIEENKTKFTNEWKKEKAEMKSIREYLKTNFAYVVKHESGCDDVYISSDMFDREMAEKALTIYLGSVGFTPPGGFKFRWRRTRLIVQGM